MRRNERKNERAKEERKEVGIENNIMEANETGTRKKRMTKYRRER
jgi:hypothetical protein